MEVKDFINKLSQEKQIQASAKQIKFLQNKSRGKIGSPDSVGSEFSVALLKLREFLPPKPYCDRLVLIYCQHFERTFRVLHIPTFTQRYNQIWTSEQADICTSSSIIPELTAIMTMAYHMDDAQQAGDDRDHRRYLKGPAMDLIQAWLDELGRKQRTELSTLQVEVLLLLSRSLRGLQPEKLWTATGALVRSALVMGLNLDPTSISGINPYTAEMRRRLWATILEIDLQASMFCGMPLVVPELNPSSAMPSNINDVDFNETSAFLPTSSPKNTYTDNLYQVLLASSLPQRMKALSIIQHSTPDIQEGIKIGREVEECLAQKPKAMNLHGNNRTLLDVGSMLHRILLDLYMRRPVLCLYKALLLEHQTQNATNEPMLAEMEKHCLESSQAILSYQDLYTISNLAMVANSTRAHQDFIYNACKMDVLWAALTLCQNIKGRLGASTPKAASDISALICSVETTLGYLIDRIGQKGSDLKDIVFLALVLQSVQISESDVERTQLLHQTAMNTLATCREKLLQPLITNKPLPPMAPFTERMNVDATPLSASRPNTVTPPVSNPRLTPASTIDSALPMNLPASSEQWFDDLSDLALEFNAFQADMFDPNDPLNFGIAHNWNWEHMWQ